MIFIKLQWALATPRKMNRVHVRVETAKLLKMLAKSVPGPPGAVATTYVKMSSLCVLSRC